MNKRLFSPRKCKLFAIAVVELASDYILVERLILGLEKMGIKFTKLGIRSFWHNHYATLAAELLLELEGRSSYTKHSVLQCNDQSLTKLVSTQKHNTTF